MIKRKYHFVLLLWQLQRHLEEIPVAKSNGRLHSSLRLEWNYILPTPMRLPSSSHSNGESTQTEANSGSPSIKHYGNIHNHTVPYSIVTVCTQFLQIYSPLVKPTSSSTSPTYIITLFKFLF